MVFDAVCCCCWFKLSILATPWLELVARAVLPSVCAAVDDGGGEMDDAESVFEFDEYSIMLLDCCIFNELVSVISNRLGTALAFKCFD